MWALCGYKERKVAGALWDCTLVWESDTVVVTLWSWIHVAQWAGRSRVGNRKQEVISRDDLKTLGCGVHQENNNRHSHCTWHQVCVCVCVCKQKEEKEDITDRQRSETRLYYPETKESQHPHMCVCMCVCVKSCWTLTSVFQHLQYHSK